MQFITRVLAFVAIFALLASVVSAANSTDNTTDTGNSTGNLVQFPYCQTSALCVYCWEKQPTVCYQCMTGTHLSTSSTDCDQDPVYTPSNAASTPMVIVLAYSAVAVILAIAFAA